MSHLLLVPLKFLGFAAAGAGLAVGWKLGSYVVDAATDPEMREKLFGTFRCSKEQAEPLWKRTFSKVSED
jgi:hypothetical protein